MASTTETCLQQCDRCREPFHLLAEVELVIVKGPATEYRYRHVCADCWRALGSPWPRGRSASPEQEQRARERMQDRGGPDRYRVLAGKT